MMSGIRGKNTRPEILLRKALHAKGFRYRLHDRKLPGKPDLVFPGREAIIHVHGCFWHGHDCRLFRWPSSRPEFWRDKIARNRVVDARTFSALETKGWRQAVVWECAMKGRGRLPFSDVVDQCEAWLRNDTPQLEIRGD